MKEKGALKQRKKFPYIGTLKLHNIGGSYALIIPREWFEAHGIDPSKLDKLPVMASEDFVIRNPKATERLYEMVSRAVKASRENVAKEIMKSLE
jgi:antitoxin component of MazEF toxin-antitoxin module